jgi:molecular chaperone DnaJ
MSVTQHDYYAILGVPRDADATAIKSAFRKLALQYHPDRNKEPGAENRFREAAEAYAVLSDPEKRAAYDSGQARGASVSAPEDIFSHIDFGDLFGGLGFDFAGAGFFDPFRHQRHRPRTTRGANLEVEINISLEQVVSGGEETVRLTRPATCGVCHGVGAQPGVAPQPCPSCHGIGEHVMRWREGGLLMQQIVPCATCHGQGRVYTVPCTACRGKGVVERQETLRISIPIGIEDGMILRVPGQGAPSPEPGGIPGDLFVVIHLVPDPRFECRGIDLWQTVLLSAADCVLGTRVEVPTIGGFLRLTIPHGTQPETVLRLRRQGLPEFGDGSSRGDMYVRVRVRLPERPRREERELYERLRTLQQGGTDSQERRQAPPPPLEGWLATVLRGLRDTIRRWWKRISSGEPTSTK